jgi:DHA2 family multidrug resistance protein
MATFSRAFLAHGLGPIDAQHAALGLLDRMAVRQTMLLSYMDAFRLMGVFFVACVPFLVFFSKGQGGAAPAPLH